MNLFSIQLIVFFVFLIADIVFYFILRNPSFPLPEQREVYEILSILLDPIFIGGILFGLNAFRKSHEKTAFILITIPLLTTLLFYGLFR